MDSKGRNVDGLAPEDPILFDNHVPQRVQVDWAAYPISLLVAVETGSNAVAVLDKLGRSGILSSHLLAADRGETKVIPFSDEVKLRQNFTANPYALTNAMRGLTVYGGESAAYDGILRASQMLGAAAAQPAADHSGDRRSARPPQPREDRRGRSRSAAAECGDLLAKYSAFPTPFTQRNKTDRNSEPIPSIRTLHHLAANVK